MTQVTVSNQGREGDGLPKAVQLLGQAVSFVAEESVSVLFPEYEGMSLAKKIAISLAATVIPTALGTIGAVTLQHKNVGRRQRQGQGRK